MLADEADKNSRFVCVATTALAQFAMDFDSNFRRIAKAINIAKGRGAKIVLLPELTTTGYCCFDHFLESDTVLHSWQTIEMMLDGPLSDGCLIDVGAPVVHNGVRYNCRVIIAERKILLIRPKISLANDGNYRETRWFVAWQAGYVLQDYFLPRNIVAVTGQLKAPFGVGIISTGEINYASETCEELFTANNTSIVLCLAGADIIANGSGSHHTLGKRERRFQLIQETTRKSGGLYLYSNQLGLDSDRLLFDGSANITCNGTTLACTSQFSVEDIEVAVTTVDMIDVVNYRANIASRGVQASQVAHVPRVEAFHLKLVTPRHRLVTPVTVTPDCKNLEPLSVEEEIALHGATWLWGFLRRSGQAGLFLALSGGADSAATACMAGLMCKCLVKAMTAPVSDPEATVAQLRAAGRSTHFFGRDPAAVLDDVRRVLRDPSYTPGTAQELCSRILFCVYMGTENSSDDTLQRAKSLSSELGCWFRDCRIDSIVDAFSQSFASLDKAAAAPDPRAVNTQQGVANENLQARTRMVMAYLCAQMCRTIGDKSSPWPGNLLVLGSAQLSEAYMGYYTKYDCSAADLNPIAGISKPLLKRFLRYIAKEYPTAARIAGAHATAELQPKSETGEQAQVSEDEIGINFEDLDVLSSLRQDMRCGPLLMFYKLRTMWSTRSPQKCAEQVKLFFSRYSKNRHKMTILPPGTHMQSNSCDDNRYDERQILYNVTWPRQFASIDKAVEEEMKLLEMEKRDPPPVGAAAVAAASATSPLLVASSPPGGEMLMVRHLDVAEGVLPHGRTAEQMERALSSAVTDGGAGSQQEPHALAEAKRLLTANGYSVSCPNKLF